MLYNIYRGNLYEQR